MLHIINAQQIYTVLIHADSLDYIAVLRHLDESI